MAGLTFGLCVLAQASVSAWTPSVIELDAAISTGDFSGYVSGSSEWLSRKVPAETNRISAPALKALLAEPAVNAVLCQRQLIAKAGAANIGAFAKAGPDNKAFLSWLLRDTKATELFLEAATPTGLKAREEGAWTLPADALEIWKKIYTADPESRQGLYLKLAMGTALCPPGKNGRGAGGVEPPVDPLIRYTYFKKAHKNRELAASFDVLNAWEYSKAVSSHASDADLTWGREMINTYRPDLLTGEMVVNITGQVWRRNSPVPYTNMPTVLQGGGKCGPRSSFAVFICQAFGIPAIGVAQPAHACVAWRGTDGVWQVGYGKGWAASRLDGLTGPDFVEGSLARSRAAQFSQVEHLRWLAAALASHGQTGAVMTIAKKIAQEAPAVKTDMNASLNPEEANADPGVEAAKAGKVTAKKDSSSASANGVFKPVNGVIHVDAAAFSKQEGQTMFGGPSLIVQECHTGGKQIYFPQQLNFGWTEYRVEAPAAGKYELTMKTASINDGQILQVGSDAFNAVALAKVPMSHGLWATTPPVDVKLVQGVQAVRITVVPGQRGVAIHSFELRQKEKGGGL
ncbi:MAG: hypothetical protein WCK89_04610 [bacterium]